MRLVQGDMAQATVFNDDPAEQSIAFEDMGFSHLHVVDLDGAFAGKPMNSAAVERILAACTMKVQLGGGIRDFTTVAAWLGMDDIADATRAVSAELDATDLMGNNPYTLEVSSPGVDRPLTLPRHWRRNAGRLVKVTFSGDSAPVEGRIVAGDEDGATLSVDGDEVRVAFADVQKAKIQIEFKPRED